MKQGMTRKLKPKAKQDTKSWQRRNEARKPLQERHERAQMAREDGKTLLADAIEQEAV